MACRIPAPALIDQLTIEYLLVEHGLLPRSNKGHLTGDHNLDNAKLCLYEYCELMH
jgi:hypothetical protein